jgi:hypothetical protein
MQCVSVPLSCLPSTGFSSRLGITGKGYLAGIAFKHKKPDGCKNLARPVNDLTKGAYSVSGCTTDCAEESAEFCAASQAE